MDLVCNSFGKYGKFISEEELQRRTHPAWPYLYFNPGKPVEPEKVDEILKGCIDLHVHGAPLGGWLPGRPTMVNTCIEASEAGMKAMVFKDHYTMVNNCAIIIQDFLTRMKQDRNLHGMEFEPVEVYGGITLNRSVGGMNVHAVRAALDYGRCKEVWLPSLDSFHQCQAMGKTGGIRVTESASSDELTREMKDILDVLADYNKNVHGDRTVLSTCHVSNREKISILQYVRKRKMDIRVLMDHVTQALTIITPDDAREMISLGGYLEFAECSCIPWPGMQDWIIAFDYSFQLILQLIAEKKTDHLVLVSDAGQPGNPPVPGWRMFIKTLLAQGISETEIRIMAKDVPSELIFG